jgi:hypothetical protein
MPSRGEPQTGRPQVEGLRVVLSARAREFAAWSVNFDPLMPGVEGPSTLPGGELVSQGIRDLERGVESAESLLVSIGAPRLRRLGFALVVRPREVVDALEWRESAEGAVSAEAIVGVERGW